MSNILKPDICVIGAGSGGLSVAAAAAAFGVDVVLIEKGEMGGDCLNHGCIPSKAMLAAGKRAEAMRTASKFGIAGVEPKVDFAAVNRHVHDVIAAIAPHDSVERFTALGVQVIRERGVFIDGETVQAGQNRIKARRFVIATGSSPSVPPIVGLEKVPYFTNETIFENCRKLPHLIVVGGGPIGMEMAQAHRRLGSKVTVVEGAKVLGKDDPELALVVAGQLRAEGVEIIEGAKIRSVATRGKSGVRTVCEADGQEIIINGTHLLVATGRAANVWELGLEKAGIAYDNKGISVKEDLRTTNRRVYAIGDVTGNLQFTHVAGYHAGLVIRGILFRLKAKPDYQMIPWVTYTDPELAQIGLNEQQAIRHYGKVRVLKWSYADNDRAVAERQATGQIKIMTGKRGRILGVSIVGKNAGEMINMWALAIANGMKAGKISAYISPYPTMSEIGKRAIVSSYAPMAANGFVRWVIGFLRRFG